MLVSAIQAELVRLQLHPVNLSVSAKDERLVALQGSLLQYWNLPRFLDGAWLLAQLRGFRDAAGPDAVMSGLAAVCGNESVTAKPSESRAQLRLFDAQAKNPARPATAKEEA